MKQVVVQGIILSRVNYGEADRILTVLSRQHGKIRLMAKGVRRVKSKLAGGVELFSVADLTYIEGRGEVKTLISSRLEQHYGRIVEELARTQVAYDAMKLLNKTVEDEVDSDYFELLKNTLAGLNDLTINHQLTELWFYIKLLNLAGHSPNLKTDSTGQELAKANSYSFSFDDMAFNATNSGSFSAEQIKILRLCSDSGNIARLKAVKIPVDLVRPLVQLVKMIFRHTH